MKNSLERDRKTKKKLWEIFDNDRREHVISLKRLQPHRLR